MSRPEAPAEQFPAPSRKIGDGAVGGAPPPMSFWNVPVRLYWYCEPSAAAASMTVTVIDVGVPVQLAVGEHTAVTVATLRATTLSLVRAPFWHSRRMRFPDTT